LSQAANETAIDTTPSTAAPLSTDRPVGNHGEPVISLSFGRNPGPLLMHL
jgi:hypothetical protein